MPSDATTSWQPGVISVGVPLSVEQDVRDISQLGFRGAAAAQFRVLQRDPATRCIRWVQVHFLATDPQDDFALTDGSGSFGGSSLGRDHGGEIVVDTGAAVFHIQKQGFRFLDTVLIDGRPVAGARPRPALTAQKAGFDADDRAHADTIAAAPQGGLVVLADGQRFESARDTSSRCVLEENGPVRCVVLQEGVLRNAAGERHLGYTVRMQFDRQATHVRIFVTLRNAERASLTAKPFDAAWLELPLGEAAAQRVTCWVGGQRLGGVVAASEGVLAYQADNDQLRTGRTSRIVNELCAEQGVSLRIGDADIVSLGNSQDALDGLLQVVGPGGTVVAGMRDMAAQFPDGFQVQDGMLGIDIFSRQNAQQGLLFAWGAHETREMFFDFSRGFDPDSPEALAQQERGAAALQRMQAPWIGRCSFEHYRDSGAVFGEKRLVGIEEEKAFFAAQGHTWNLHDLRRSDLEYERQYSFHTTGGGNQFDQDLTRLIDFMRANHTGRFLQARLDVLWKADQAVYHSDDFDMAEYQNGVYDFDAPDPDTFHGKGAGSLFDDEHPHWPSMMLYYWMTGDERVRAAIEDYGEYRRYRAGHPFWGAINGGGLNHFRLWSRAYRDMALLYEFTGQERYLESLRTMTRALTGSIETGRSRGRNLQRGYFYFGDPDDPRRRIHLFFLTEIHPIAVREALRVLPADDPLREDLRDYLTGLAWFTLREARVDDHAPGYPYGYYSAEANVETGRRGDQTGLLLAHGYMQTGDMEFARSARELAWRVIEAQHELRASELSMHVRIYTWLHRDALAVDLLEPRVQRNLDGSATLRWRVPEGAQEFIIRYGRKRLVANLDFQQRSRTYRVDPHYAMNVWAAHNLAGEPQPGRAGEMQEWRTPILPEGEWHFAVQVIRKAKADAGLDVEELQGAAAATSVSLSWNLHPSTQGSVESISVERAPRALGPWETVSRAPFRPETAMSFDDSDITADEVYFYRLRLRALDGSISWTKPIQVRTARKRVGLELLPPRDPPHGDPVAIDYRLAQPSSLVLLSIYDVRGRRLRSVRQGQRPAGRNRLLWNRRDSAGSRVTRGWVFLCLEADGERRTQKLLLR